MSFATEGFSAMMSFFVTKKQRPLRTGRLRSGPRYAKRRIISVIGRRGKKPPPASRASGATFAESVHLATAVVGNQLVEDQGVDVAVTRPQHHQHDHLELVGADGLAGQRHRPLDDELAQERGEYLRAFEKRDEPAALDRELGYFVGRVPAERRARVQRLRDAVVGLARQAVEPIERIVDVLVLEARGVELSLERVVVRIRLRRVVVLKQVYEYVEHDSSTDALV